MAAAAERFATRGLDGVRLDEIADTADVARGTLYSHFASKDALVVAIIRPALELAVRAARELGSSDARQAIDQIAALYLRLWDDHADALRVSHRLGRMPSPEVEQLHGTFVAGLKVALASAAAAGILRAPSPELAVRVIARVAVPLLELYEPEIERDRLFSQSLRGLLVADG